MKITVKILLSISIISLAFETLAMEQVDHEYPDMVILKFVDDKNSEVFIQRTVAEVSELLKKKLKALDDISYTAYDITLNDIMIGNITITVDVISQETFNLITPLLKSISHGGQDLDKVFAEHVNKDFMPCCEVLHAANYLGIPDIIDIAIKYIKNSVFSSKQSLLDIIQAIKDNDYQFPEEIKGLITQILTEATPPTYDNTATYNLGYPISIMCALPDGSLALVSPSPNSHTVKILDQHTGGQQYIQLGQDSDNITALCPLPNSNDLVVGTAMGKMYIVDLTPNSRKLTDFDKPVHSGYIVSICPGKKLLNGSLCIISLSQDKTIKIWNTKTWEPIDTIYLDKWYGHKKFVSSLCVTPKYAITGSCDSTIKIWNLERGRGARTLRGYTGTVSSLCTINNKKLLISAADNIIKIWNLKQDGSSVTLKKSFSVGDNVSVLFACVIPGHDDPNFLATALTDGTVQIWDLDLRNDLANAQVIEIFSLVSKDQAIQGTRISSMCTTSDGESIIIALSDGTITILDLNQDDIKELFTALGLKPKI